MDRRLPGVSGMSVVGAGLLVLTVHGFGGALVGQEPPGEPSQEAQKVLDGLLDDRQLTKDDVEGLNGDGWSALRASCKHQYDTHKRTERRFRSWTVIHDRAVGHLAPIRNSHQNRPRDLESGRFAAAFKLEAYEGATIDEDDFSGLFEGRGCILVVRNTATGAGAQYAGIAVPYEEDRSAQRCRENPTGCRTEGRYLEIRVRTFAVANEREATQWHAGDLPARDHFDTPARRVPRTAGQHEPTHACFSCVKTGWCEG